MFEKQFKIFLVEQLIHWAQDIIKPGFRYQFQSPCIDNSKQLFEVLKEKCVGEVIIPNGMTLPYIDVNGVKLIPILHRPQNGVTGFSENYVSYLRDLVASQSGTMTGCALVIIHNSFLDTLISSADNLAEVGMAWCPQRIKESLQELMKNHHKTSEVSDCLLDYQFEVIQEDETTVFGFDHLYNAVCGGEIKFSELEMFDDPFVLEMGKDKKQIKKRLDENRDLYKKTEFAVTHFSEQLDDKLKEFGSKFIKKNFGDNQSWRSITYGVCLDEINKNKEQNLILEFESLEQGEVLPRNKSSSKSGQRDRQVLILLEDEQTDFELKLNFTGAELDKKQFKVSPGKALGSTYQIKTYNSVRTCSATLRAQYCESPIFFTLSLNRETSAERYKFRCLVVKKSEFFLKPIYNCFVVDVAKKRLTLNTDSNSLQINETLGSTYTLQDNAEAVDIETYGVVSFADLACEENEVRFFALSGANRLEFNIEGAISTDSFSLPLMLDRDRFVKLYDDDYNGELLSKKGKVALDNSEYVVKGVRLKLLRLEERFVQERALALFDERSIPLFEIEGCASELYRSYVELFDYLAERKTVLSIASWGADLQRIVDHIIEGYLVYVEAIQHGQVLSAEQKLVLKIGTVDIEGGEYFSPFHPLNLSYFLNICCHLQNDKHGEKSFRTLPDVTVDRFSAKGLLPYIYHQTQQFSYSQQIKENALWLKQVPYEESSYSFVSKLVKEKVNEFQAAYSQLFASSSKNQIIINAVNQGYAEELFLGLVDIIRNEDNATLTVHVNIYDDHVQFCAFDRFAEETSYDEIKEWLKLNKGKVREHADTIIDHLRTRLTYSKFTNNQAKHGQNYAHLTFFRSNERVESSPVVIENTASGVSCEGILGGEASENKTGVYFTGFGLRNVDYKSKPHLRVAKALGELTQPALKPNTQYHENSAMALTVNDGFKDLLERSYQNSIWTTIIDPKVTLDFFQTNSDVILIHYSDQYTSSSSYDAITVTKQTELFSKVLEGGGGLVSEFNAFNGDWLLKMLTYGEKERKEKLGILGAYKFIASLFKDSDITWIPLSVAEMIRVSGGIGLKMSDSDFSRNVHGYKKGAISDDILFVGVKGKRVFLLPVEVKTGKTADKKKAVEQANELRRYLVKDILGPKTFAAQIYRSLFIQQIFMQVDKYRLYDVYHSDYFDNIISQREQLLAGTYQICEIEDYPNGFVVFNSESEACFVPSYELDGEILSIELPASLLPRMVSKTLKEVMFELDVSQLCHVPQEFLLGASYSYNIYEHLNIDFSQPQLDQEKIEIKEDSKEREEIDNARQLDIFAQIPEQPADVSIAKSRVLIGRNQLNSEQVYWEYDHPDLANRHMIIFGRSGQGKTYCIQGLIMSLADNSINSTIIDYTNGFLPNHLEPEFSQSVKPQSHVLCHQPLAMSPFRQQEQDFGGIHIAEKPHTVAGRVASVFNKVYSSIGERQLAVLNNVIEQGVLRYGERYDFRCMHDDLLEEGSIGEALASKLSPLVKSNLFDSDEKGGWGKMLNDKEVNTNILQLASLSHDTSMLASEFMLWDLYAYASSYGSKEKPLPIVLDEVQNLDHRLASPLGKMLTEGRKYGISLILATQTLSMLAKEEQDRLFQASHKLFFAPAETEVEKYAKILELSIRGSNRKEWVEQLSQLKKGECLSVGYHLNNNDELDLSVKKVKVSALSER